jgi:restriction endonuclease S subunit
MRKYQSYKPSGVEWIGEIPVSWNTTKLKYFLDEIITGGTPDTSNEEYWIDNGINWISISDITSSPDGILETKKTISEEGRKSKNLKVLEPNSLIYSIYGSIGKVNRIKVPSTIHQGILSFITNKKLNNYYLEKYLIFLQPFISSFSSSNTQDNLNQDKIKNLFIQVPPLQEQEQIVHYLDEKTNIIDKLISTKQRKVELLKEQRTTLINQVITKGLNPNVKMKDSGMEWIEDIPESWSFVRLGVLGNFSKGKGITKDKIKENGFPCIRNGEIYTTYNLRFSEPKSFIDEITITESIKVKKGTLFFTGDGETLEEIGKCVVYLGEEEIYVGGGINVFTPKTDKVSPIYLSYVMSSSSCVYQKSLGGKGEIVVHIYSKQLRDIQFGLPKLEEQEEIVEYLDKHTKEIDDLVSMEQNKIELLKEYRQSLISEVITGKIKVVE